MRNLLAILLLLAGCATTRPPAAAPPAHYALVVFDRQGISASEAGGAADRAARRPLTIDDPVRIASISKLVVALGVMRLVEQGVLDLDRDASDWLGWRLRNPAFPDRPITLRMLLSHRSSLRDEADYVIPLGGELRATLGNPAAFDSRHPPGDYFVYANLNFPVIATVMEAATRERFDLLMQRLVLGPLGLDACFNWTTCSDAAVRRAVVLYRPDGAVARDDLGGARPDCPVVAAADGSCAWRSYRPGANGALFSPQGGLRISLRDLATVGRLYLNQGRHGGATFLSPAMMSELSRPHWRFDGSNGDTQSGFYCGYGLAVQILAQCAPSDDLLDRRRSWTGHAGDAYGLRSGLWLDPATGAGIAYFAIGVAADAPGARTSFTSAEEWLARRATALVRR